MKRKAIILALCASMALSVPMGVSATSVTDFTDVPADSWYYDDVKGAVDHGYMNGTSGSTFDPSNQMTRAMATTVFARFDEAVVDDSKPTIFTDVPVNQWYTGSIAWANEQKLVEGVGDNRFSPNNFISRQDMAVIMDRYIKNKGYSLKESPLIDSFKDASSISDYAREAVENCRKYGLINGYDDGTFGPKTDISRAQAAAMFERMKVVVDNNQITPEPPKPSGGGGGGGSSTTYTYADYGVTAKVEKENSSYDLTLTAVNATDTPGGIDKQDKVYHVRYANGAYTPIGSDAIELVEVMRDLFNEDDVDKIISGMTEPITVAGEEQSIIIRTKDDANNDIYQFNSNFIIKKIKVSEIIDKSTYQDIADEVTAVLVGTNPSASVDSKDVENLINKLDNEDAKIESEEEKEIALNIAGKLSHADEDQLLDKALKASGLENEKQLEEMFGVTKESLGEMAKDYAKKLDEMANAYTPSGISMLAESTEGDSTMSSGGVGVGINLGYLICNAYNNKDYGTDWDTIWDNIAKQDADLAGVDASTVSGPTVNEKQKEVYDAALALYEACNPTEFLKDGDDKYTLKATSDIEKKLAVIITQVDSLRKAYIGLSENSSISVDKLNTMLQSICGTELELSSEGNIDTLLNLPAPTLADITGTTDYILKLEVEDAGSIVNNILSKAGVDQEVSATGLNGKYSVTISVDRKVDNSLTGVHK